MLEKKVNIKTALLISVIISIGLFAFLYAFWGNEITAETTSNNLPANNSQSCEYNVIRLNGYKLIKPLLFVEPNCE